MNSTPPSTPTQPRVFQRSSTNKVFGGVAGGLGEYFNIDAALMRVLVVVATFMSGGTAVFGYIALWMARDTAPADTNTEANAAPAPVQPVAA